MKWRLQEGQGEAIYEIGVEDNGMLAGLTHSELTASMKTLHNMAMRYMYINICILIYQLHFENISRSTNTYILFNNAASTCARGESKI